MNKVQFTLTAGLLALAFTFFGCDTQRVQVPNDEKKFLGTWINEGEIDHGIGDTLVFNPGGTGTNDGRTFKYAVVSGKLAIVMPSMRYGEIISDRGKTFVVDLVISNDGKTAIASTDIGVGFLLRKID